MQRPLILVVRVTLACAVRAQGQSAGCRDASGVEAMWRYCLAVSETAATVYLSAPLLTSTPLDSLERKFDRRMAETVTDHHPSLCPLASSAAEAEALRGVAIHYNRSLGHTARVIEWREDERSP